VFFEGGILQTTQTPNFLIKINKTIYQFNTASDIPAAETCFSNVVLLIQAEIGGGKLSLVEVNQAN